MSLRIGDRVRILGNEMSAEGYGHPVGSSGMVLEIDRHSNDIRVLFDFDDPGAVEDISSGDARFDELDLRTTWYFESDLEPLEPLNV